MYKDIFSYFQGTYSELTDIRINSLTQAEILDTINNRNVSGIFLKDFHFIDLLGKIKYNENGDIIGQ